jgi:outer membrane protein assembly factor BamB
MIAPLLAAALLATAVAAGAEPAAQSVRVGGDWTRFGYDAARHNAGPAATGLTAANLATLRQQRIRLEGTADSSPIYLRGVSTSGGVLDLFVVTTSYGKTIAVDATTGGIVWQFTPTGYASWAGSSRITHSSPVADPARRFAYSASPDGRIHKLDVASGREVQSGEWPVAITRDSHHEKIGPALNFAHGTVFAATGGYFGDAPPYQGHVVAIDAVAGRLQHVWNALCSNRPGLISTNSCGESGSAIWARSGVVVEPSTGQLLVTTGNGKFDGRANWGDSVLILSRDAARLLRNWTPRNQKQLESGDVDLGSTAPALLSPSRAVQGGKDGKLRLLDLRRPNGRTTRPGPTTGGELQTLSTPGGAGLFSTPAVWHNGGRVWLFVATDSGIAAYVLREGRLRVVWQRSVGGTSPIVAGKLLYVYDTAGALNVYNPTSGKRLARLSAGPGHWNSPIVTDGRIALPEGDANDHRMSGLLNIYRAP